MRDDLSELLERVDLCRTRCRDLEMKIATLAAASITHRLRWIAPGAGQILAKLSAHPPVSIRQEVGMIVNEQRSILDALACALATRNRANDIRGVYFPIAKSKADFSNKTCRDKIQKLAEADQQTIKDMKPWLPSTDDPADGNRLLFCLNEADNVRKHQSLLRWACHGGVRPVGSGEIGHLVADGVIFTEVGKEETLASFAGVTCNLSVSFEMVYYEPDSLKGRPVAPLLSAFNETVGSIVKRFA